VASVTVRDEAPGAVGIDLEIEVELGEIPAAELIRGRVIAELIRTGSVVARPLVPLSEDELALNGPRHRRELDVDREVARALKAFERGRFMLLVDGRQILGVDDVVTLSAASAVTFVRLVPLRGG
jgi:hypothetical protein